jgi:hypothetical protein
MCDGRSKATRGGFYQLACWVDWEVKRTVQELAKAESMSVSTFLRRVLEAYLSGDQPGPFDLRGFRRRGSRRKK